MNKIYFFIISFSFILFLVSINLVGINTSLKDFLLTINVTFYEPTLVWSTFIVTTAFFLLTQSKNFFDQWFKQFFVWYFPVAYGATFLFSPYGGIMTTTRYDAAIFLGGIMVLATVIWSIVAWKTAKR